MAAPVYTTDLVAITTADQNTGFDRIGTGNIEPDETDIFIVGTQSISKVAFQNASRGISYDSGADQTTTLSTGNNPNGNQYVYIWAIYLISDVLGVANPASGTDPGLWIAAGDNINANGGGNWDKWRVGGVDTFAFGTAWRCYATDLITTSPHPGVTTGAVTTLQYFGFGANVPAGGPTKGNPIAIDQIKRGSYIGVEDGVGDEATFARLATDDAENTTPNRFGLFYEVDGVYILNTEIRLGDTNAVDFTDTGSTIAGLLEIQNTDAITNNADGGKNRITFRNGSGTSNIDISNLTVISSGANNPIDIISVDQVNLTMTACSLFDVRLLQLNDNSNQTLTRCTLPQKAVTISTNNMNGTNTNARTIQNGATITSCTIDGTSTTTLTSGIEVSGTNAVDLSKITSCNFTGDGRALLLGTIAGSQGDVTVSYNGHTYDSGYTTGATQTATAGPSGTSNAVIEVNVGSGTNLIISVSNTAQIPSVRNTGTGTVEIRANITVSISGIHGASEVRVLQNPSPYSATSLPAPTAVALASTERVSADIIVGDGTNYIQYTNNNGKLRINAVGTATFDEVLTNGDTISNSPNGSALTDGDQVCVFIRDDDDNPTLQLEDDGLIVASGGTGQTAPTASTIDTDTDFATFTSVFGTTLNSANSKTVSIENKEAVYEFAVPINTVIDFLVFKIGDEPFLVTEQTITDANNSFPISQVGDRTYKNPA